MSSFISSNHSLHLENASSAGLWHNKVWLLEVGVVAGSGVDGLVAHVSVHTTSVVVVGGVLEAQDVGVAVDECSDALGLGDGVAEDVVGWSVRSVEAPAALAVDWGVYGWVVLERALDGNIKIIITTRR